MPQKKRRGETEPDELIDDLERRIDMQGAYEMNQTYSYREISEDSKLVLVDTHQDYKNELNDEWTTLNEVDSFSIEIYRSCFRKNKQRNSTQYRYLYIGDGSMKVDVKGLMQMWKTTEGGGLVQYELRKEDESEPKIRKMG